MVVLPLFLDRWWSAAVDCFAATNVKAADSDAVVAADAAMQLEMCVCERERENGGLFGGGLFAEEPSLDPFLEGLLLPLKCFFSSNLIFHTREHLSTA